MNERTLSVFANPYTAYDHKGRACGALLCDPVNHVAYQDRNSGHVNPEKRSWERRRFVGAEIDDKATTVSKGKGDPLTHEQDTVWSFSSEPVKVPDTEYYREHLRHGAILAADEATAKACGIKFVPYKDAIEGTKKTLAAKWRAHYPDAELPDWAPPQLALVKSKKEVA